MNTSTSQRLRWAVPAAAVTVVAGAVLVPAAFANAGPGDLAPRSAEELLTDLAGHELTALSGTVVQTSRLGLPELPAATAGAGPLALTAGSNTLMVWTDGEDRARVALLSELAEYDVVRDGDDVWTYSSEQDEAVHYLLPEGHTGGSGDLPPGPAAGSAPGALPGTPADAAAALLAAIEPSTTIGVEEAVTVAGRPARQLVLRPKDETSLIASARLAVDAETSAPLRVQVFAADEPGLPAFEVGYTDVSFTDPDPAVSTFTPPPGAEVRQVEVPAWSEGDPATGGMGPGEQPEGIQPDGGAGADPGAGPAPAVIGDGWTSILVLEGVDATVLDPEQSALVDQFTTRVPEGRLLTTALVTALLTDDGRLLVGAVTPEALQAAA